MRKTLSLLFPCSLLFSCDFFGTEKIDEGLLPSLSGRVLSAQGSPVPGARVRLWRVPPGEDVNSLLSPPVLMGDTSAPDGSFRFHSLAQADYHMEASDSSAGIYAARRVGISHTREAAEISLTLKDLGRVNGMVTRGANPRPAGIVGDENILVRLAGTDRFAFTDAAGFYSLEAPEGAYRLAYAASDGHYLPEISAPNPVVSGGISIASRVDLEWSPLVAPPVPSGLAVRPDSDAFVIRLSWRPVQVANLAHYELLRRDTLDARNDRTFAASDTAFTDSVGTLAEGRALRYCVRAVNALGLGVFGSPVAGAVPGPFTWTLDGLVLDGGGPSLAFVRIFAAPAAPGSPDSASLPVQSVDSLYNVAATGRFSFGPFTGGPYTVEAAGFGKKALRTGVGIRRRGVVAETLSLQLPGELRGSASRPSTGIGDGGIQVSLAGTPYSTATSTDGRFSLPGVAPGTYRAVFYAPPEGFFLPESLTVTILSNSVTGISRIDMRAIPPRP